MFNPEPAPASLITDVRNSALGAVHESEEEEEEEEEVAEEATCEADESQEATQEVSELEASGTGDASAGTVLVPVDMQQDQLPAGGAAVPDMAVVVGDEAGDECMTDQASVSMIVEVRFLFWQNIAL